eukprot:jgi/Galph1/3592/GphlegSOOS_G2259.1
MKTLTSFILFSSSTPISRHSKCKYLKNFTCDFYCRWKKAASRLLQGFSSAYPVTHSVVKLKVMGCSQQQLAKDSAYEEYSKYTYYKGFRISYLEAIGKKCISKHLPIAVCVHGFGACCGHWKNNLPYLCQLSGSAYAIDLLGFGGSDKPTPGVHSGESISYTFEEWAEQLNEFVSKIVQKPVILIGNSIGCLVTMQAAVNNPSNYIGLIALNPSLRLLSERKRTGIKAVTASVIGRLLRFPLISKAFFYQLTQTKVIRKILEVAYYDKSRVTDSLVEMLQAPSKDQGARQVFVEFTNYSGGATPEELLQELTIPVAIIWGEKDPWEPIELGRNLADFPCVKRFIAVPNVGHCPHDEAPEKVNPLLEELIKSFSKTQTVSQ